MSFKCAGRWLGVWLGAVGTAFSQTPASMIRQPAGLIAITHVTVVDGTGAAPLRNQTLIIDHERIAALGSFGKVRIPSQAQVIDGTGRSVIPGLIGMHEHLFYPLPLEGTPVAVEQMMSAPALYLASGVTTARTAGSMDPYGDLQLRQRIQAGLQIGPDLNLTTPYLEGPAGIIPQMYVLRDVGEARDLIRYWHSLGMTSVKAYADIKPEVLAGSIETAHQLGMKVTGHLCSVGYRQAIEWGIDNLEHGPFGSPDGDLFPGRVGDACMPITAGLTRTDMSRAIVNDTELSDSRLQELIETMVQHHVALTSTLAVFEGGQRLTPERLERTQRLMHPLAWAHVQQRRQLELPRNELLATLLLKEMMFERQFVAAGGLLMAGCDPTGDGHTLAGLGDQRNLELLVEAGFDIPQTVRIATLNAAQFQGIAADTGSVVAGKRADLVLLDGDIAADITVIEHPNLVFKHGVGYDSNAIYASLAGQAGLH